MVAQADLIPRMEKLEEAVSARKDETSLAKVSDISAELQQGRNLPEAPVTRHNLETRIPRSERKIEICQQTRQDHTLLERLEAGRERVRQYLLNLERAAHLPQESAS